MKVSSKFFTLFALVLLAALVFAPTAYAFDGRGGEKILIPANEVVNEDLYLAATEVIVEGTIHGDLMAGGQVVIINGTVTGDLFVSGSSVTINGEVGDDLFAGAASVTLGPSAKIADDVFTGSGSLDLRAGSQVGGSVLAAAGRSLFAGLITEDLSAASGSLRLEGTVGGNADIQVGSSEQEDYMPNFTYGSGGVEIPMITIPTGLSFGTEAEVSGLLKYTSPESVTAASAVASQVQHNLPPMDEELSRELARSHAASNWVFDLIRNLVGLLVIGMLIAWLRPSWIERPAEVIRTRLLPSLGIGLVGFVTAPVVFLIALGVIILVAVLFLALSLPSLGSLTLLTGFPLLGLFFAALLVVGGYLCQAVIAYLLGQWILSKVRPEWNSKIYWPLLLGLVLISLVFAIPVAGGLLQFLVILVSLGAILYVLFNRRPAPLAPAPAAVDAL